MSDFEKEKWAPSTESLKRLRNTAIFYFAAGLLLVPLRFAAGKMVIALVAGGIICAVGIGWLLANNPVNKRTGMLITGVGILIMLSGIRISILPMITALILSVLTVGFLVLGVKYLIQYFIAENKRIY